MANPFRDMSVIMQGLVAAAIAVIVVLVGLFLPFSPVAQERDQVDHSAAGDHILCLLEGADPRIATDTVNHDRCPFATGEALHRLDGIFLRGVDRAGSDG